ncbi:MAG: hypothetical protein DRN30_01895 [Thermoplasmata archaeon]|nr:NAD(+)/NADH kinase [Euryarchaeota archaeon]RLF66556.1 MAG: hypothetical protein DRN30_01895 [Thermoplasmata archaeon]
MLKKLSLFGRIDRKESLDVMRAIIGFLEEHGVDVIVEESVSKALGLGEGVPLSELNEGEALITVGGDGTILRALLFVDLPVLPIKIGRIGFLTEVLWNEWRYALEKLLKGEFTIDERDRLEVQYKSKVFSLTNEVSFKGEKLDKINEFTVTFSSGGSWNLYCDGIIISTPTGSTGYVLSLGGPIIHPRVRGYIITPIAPYREPIRSLVLPEDEVIEVRPQNQGAYVILDGQILITISNKQKIEIRIDKNRKTRIIRIRKRGVIEDVFKKIKLENNQGSS